MIQVTAEQRSPEWTLARLAVPTASQFHRIVSTKTLKPIGGGQTYRRELLFEWVTGEPARDFGANSGMERGSVMEDEAIRWYELERGVDVERVGFCLTDDRKIGASPDGLVGDDGGLEIKCVNGPAHIAAILDGTGDYMAQCQGGMYVTGRAWWDLLLYNPAMPSVILRFDRDEAFQVALGDALGDLLRAFEHEVGRLKRLGIRSGLEARREAVARGDDTRTPEEIEAGRADLRERIARGEEYVDLF